MIIERIFTYNPQDLTPFLVASFTEGYRFMKRFVDEFDSGSNKFDKEGEGLFVAKVNNQIVGIIGINIDPYLNDDSIGRVRHLYVLPQHRNKGIASELLKTIIEIGKEKFKILTLFTENGCAEKLYLKFGFKQSNEYNKATHVLHIS